MWGCVIYGIMLKKKSKASKFLGDYLFFFGIFSTLIGMFANVDFIRNPSFADYEVTKSIVAHATLLFNILLIAAFGYIKINLFKNMLNIIISVFMMYVVGLYCNLMIEVLHSKEFADYVNSMFIRTSPFPDIKFLVYPIIALMSLVLYFGLFAICELFAYKKGNRWYNRMFK